MLSLALEYRDEAQSLAAWLICIAAFVWGGGPERGIAAIWIIVFKGLDIALSLPWQGYLQGIDVRALYVASDLFALAAFAMIAVHANRFYTLWIASFQVLAMLAHVAKELSDHISTISYAVLAFMPGYFQLGLLAGGLMLHVRRRRRNGPYRDWRLGHAAPGWQLLLSHRGHKA